MGQSCQVSESWKEIRQTKRWHKEGDGTEKEMGQRRRSDRLRDRIKKEIGQRRRWDRDGDGTEKEMGQRRR